MLIIDGYREEFSANLKSFTVKKLCEIIITARYLGSMNGEAVICMEELAKRRAEGELFDYESFIENETKKLPNIQINMKEKMKVGGFDIALLKGIK
jgi:hypothetical protein